MISAPKTGERILDFCAKLVAELQPLLGATGVGGIRIRKSGAAWRFEGETGGATLALTPLSVGVKDTGTQAAFVRICTGYCVINQDTRADWIVAPKTSGATVRPAFYDLELVTGYNFVYAQLELVMSGTAIDTDGALLAWDFSSSGFSFAKKHCDDETGIGDVLKSIKPETTTFPKLLCVVLVTAPTAGATAPNVKLLEPLYHSGNWEFAPPLLHKQFCQGDPPGPVDAAIGAVMLGAP